MSTTKIAYILNSNFIKRVIGSIVMLTLFASAIRLENIYLIALVYIIQTLTMNEVTGILHTNKKEHFDMRRINMYFIVVTNVFFIGKTIGRMYITKIPEVVFQHFQFFCFTTYSTGIIIFINSLNRKHLRAQFACFAIAHFLILSVGICANFCILNILNGKIWLVYPTLLVVTNDIFAYLFGKLFGKRPLIKLSPNKTWEGFIGGFISTLVIGMFLAYYKVRFSVFEDQKDKLLLSYISISFIKYTINIRRIYLHALSLIIFASFIAPFGGFFASGLKRAYKVKDFSGSIPGHGGFADRFDCQFSMGTFTHLYYKTFIYEQVITKESIFNLIKAKLSKDEIILLSEMIINNLINNNM